MVMVLLVTSKEYTTIREMLLDISLILYLCRGYFQVQSQLCFLCLPLAGLLFNCYPILYLLLLEFFYRHIEKHQTQQFFELLK